MWQAFVPASGVEDGFHGILTSKKRRRVTAVDGEEVSAMYESIIRLEGADERSRKGPAHLTRLST